MSTDPDTRSGPVWPPADDERSPADLFTARRAVDETRYEEQPSHYPPGDVDTPAGGTPVPTYRGENAYQDSPGDVEQRNGQIDDQPAVPVEPAAQQQTDTVDEALPVPDLTADTPLQKVVLPGLVDLILGNVVIPGRFSPHRAAGFVTRLQDVPNGTAEDLARRYGLHQVPGWPQTDELHVLRFYAHHRAPFVAPFERNVYQMDLVELPAGTELWRIDADGQEQRVGAYLHRQVGWVTTAPVPLGPARWGQPPVPLRPSVRRGLAARYRGLDFDADFGPRPGEVTLHPLPGQQPPHDFAEQAGTHTLAVSVDDLDDLVLLRWRGLWRDLPVELVDTAGTDATVHYQGEDGQRAVELGLAEVDYRVWSGLVPRSELTEMNQEVVPLRD